MEREKKDSLLMVTYFYPPAGGQGVPGSQRAVKFVRYLKNHLVTVLTVAPEYYPPVVACDFDRKLPIRDERIYRTGCYDVFEQVLKARSCLRSIASGRRGDNASPPAVAGTAAGDGPRQGGRSLAQWAKDLIYDLCYYPDGASGWILPAFLCGYRIARAERPRAIFATGMPWSALLVAWLLHLVTGVSFVADFRDPWIGNPFHASKGRLLDALGRWLERRVVSSAALVTANTDQLRDEFLRRYPQLPAEKFVVLTNGFDPDDFSTVPARPQAQEFSSRLVMAHAGFLYGKRDPAPLFEAVELLVREGRCRRLDFLFLQMGKVQLDYDFHQRYAPLIEEGGLQDLGQLPFEQCLEELQRADLLLLIQPDTKTQVPSKLYDYLCLERPILTVSPPDGALGTLITSHGFGDLFDQSEVAGIADRLEELLARKREQGHLPCRYPQRERFNIERIAAQLDRHLTDVGAR
ncbi:glycosyltransferase [Geomonas sp.]|uniref:glycosyltransferase n=1 Tax=Geomonas sp. TaxID=2651584 RepID=UPI002B45A1C2|nr:glycosyltransferase [Geomonas sp.]HJV36211.1 glycosyltransferase [Geomonas sp.]